MSSGTGPDTGSKRAPSDAISTDEVCRVIGERVRELRLSLGLTMERLALDAGLSLGMLSKIENGQTSPSLSSLTALANAGNVPLTALFRGLDDEQDALVVRAGEGLEIGHKGDGPGRRYQDLGSLRGPIRQVEPVLVTISDAEEVFPLFQHGGVELIYIVEGVVEYGYGAKRYTLGKGDTMQLHGEVPHGPTKLVELPIQFLSLKIHPRPET